MRDAAGFAPGSEHTDMGWPITPDGFTVNDMLRMWVWHFWSHHRELVLARGRLTGDNPHFHVPHYVRQASEAFGAFVGELACLSDEQLDKLVEAISAKLDGAATTVSEVTDSMVEDATSTASEEVPSGADAER